MAGREGFEPPEVLPSTVFKTAAFNHSAISRKKKDKVKKDNQKASEAKLNKIANKIWRRHSESNRGMEALQASALPLGYVATC